MANMYRSTFIDPYPNGWKNKPDETTPIDAAALQPITDCVNEMDTFLDGCNKDSFSNTKTVKLTKSEYDSLPESKLTDGVLYIIMDGGAGVFYPNYEQEEF